MDKEITRSAQRMLARAKELGVQANSGNPLVIDLMEELLAASQGYRNRHTWRAAMAKREPAALVQEHPDECGNDFKLVHGKGCWLTMGQFSVHPYLTDEGVVVDVYAKGAEDGSIASTWAHDNDAEAALCEWEEIDPEEARAWALKQRASKFDELPAAQRYEWLRKYAQSRKVTP